MISRNRKAKLLFGTEEKSIKKDKRDYNHSNKGEHSSENAQRRENNHDMEGSIKDHKTHSKMERLNKKKSSSLTLNVNKYERLKRYGVIMLKILCVVVFVPPFLNYASLHQERNVLIPKGSNLYDVGRGLKLLLKCEGTGSPTLILDAPTGVNSDIWSNLQSKLSKYTTVCAYDRAGLGFSERPLENSSDFSQSRWQYYTVEKMAEDLRFLITSSSQQRKPFIMVGSEIGALVSQFYTLLNEHDVSDVVLINSLTSDLFTHDANWIKFWNFELLPWWQMLHLSASLGISRILILLRLLRPQWLDNDLSDEEIINRQHHLLCNPRHMKSVVDEHYFINDSISQMETLQRIRPFPADVSLTMITGKEYGVRASSSLNRAWHSSHVNFMQKFHPKASHIIVDIANQKMLHSSPNYILDPIKQIILKRQRRM